MNSHDSLNNSNLLISIQGVTAGYASNLVLQNITIDLHSDDFVGIIGPNGGGKTTLLKVITGQIKPVSGTIHYRTSKPVNIGYLPQISRFDREFPISVFEVVASGLISKSSLYRSRYTSDEKDKVFRIIHQMGISDIASASIGQLSGGQMQRAFLGRAVVSSPDILVLDEPGTYVDSKFEKEFFHLLAELNKEMAIIVVSHDLGTIASSVKSIACVNRHLHFHPGNEITEEHLRIYDCPVDLVTHGATPHRVLRNHTSTIN